MNPRAMALLATQKPIAEISAETGVPVPTLYRWARSLPAQDRQRRGRAAEVTERRRELLRDGRSPADVAAGVEFGLPRCSPSAMRQLRATVKP